MEIEEWDQRYRSRERAGEDLDAAPTPLVVEMASRLALGTALDLACGSGRNALLLARRGWDVTAVDGAASAIDVLRERAKGEVLAIDAVVADLKRGEFRIEAEAWDLIAITYYLQRDLFPSIKAGVKPGGAALVIVHITEGDEQPTAHRLRPGELLSYFEGWTVLHSYEGKPADTAHRRAVAEIVAQRAP